MTVLTIVVPTYNRASSLKLLLDHLRQEIDGKLDDVAVLVSDNASSDATAAVVAEVKMVWTGLQARRQIYNVGGDENFCSCLDLVGSDYFWIVGDDDLPKPGVVAQVAALLRAQAPDLLYMRSEWLSPVTSASQGDPVGELHWRFMSRRRFVARVHVWFTFISGVVVARGALQRSLGGETLRRFSGSSLVQLGWVLPVVAGAERFIFVSDRCVLASKGNSGGYAVLTTFGANFPGIVKAVFSARPSLARMLIRRHLLRYLPGLVWELRRSGQGRFSDERPWRAMRVELGRFALFWALVVPLGRLPGALAAPVHLLWRIVNRMLVEWDERALR